MRISGKSWQGVIFCVAISVLLGFAFSVVTAGESTKAKYIFLIIGDGMGPNQRQVAQEALCAKEKNLQAKLVMNTLPIQGMASTAPDGGGVTDSAAAGTALACGIKTKNGVLGLGPDKKTPAESMAELAKKKGMKIGILTSVSLDHATPGAFYAHVQHRNMTPEIATAMFDSGFDYFAGGTLNAIKKDKKTDYFKLAGDKGLHIVRSLDQLKVAEPNTRIYAMAEKLDGESLPFAIDAGNDPFTLTALTAEGIRLLDNPKGFFMMIEGGKIDWACHANDLGAAVGDIFALDAAVAIALKFYQQHPDETLIVVTADHETGGINKLDAGNPAVLLAQQMSAQEFGKKLKKMQDQNATAEQVIAAVKEVFGLKELDQTDEKEIGTAWNAVSKEPDDKKSLYGKSNNVMSAVRKIASRQAGYQFSSGGHSGADVPVSAIGVGAEMFKGTYPNTDIFKNIVKVME